MLRIQHVHKYFNRGKKNQIHVINDTNIEAEGKGLIALLGPSGSGKTTLLNAIGGLDRVQMGAIFINGEKLTRQSAGKIDKIRSNNIGYIFQNYNLIDHMTVFDNIAVALKMAGIKDKKEIQEKVNYILEKVGLYRYRNRYADMLSGGERQRVAIARALVKNPSVLIADEPTGNLDSKNTLEIMNIIKEISKHKLVIFVTHEEKLAQFYASRIIRLVDGKIISDEENSDAGNLDYRLENEIYLRDIEDHKKLKTQGYNVDFYNEDNEEIELDIVVKNGNVYIQSKDPNKRLEIVQEDSSIKLIDDNYKTIEKDEVRGEAFDTGKLANNKALKYSSIISFPQMLIKGFKTIYNYNRIKKILLLGFFVSAMFITYAIASIFGVLNINDTMFVKEDQSHIRVISKKVSVDKYLGYEQNDAYNYVLPGDSSVSASLKLDEYLQTAGTFKQLKGTLSDYAELKKGELIAGELPKTSNEVVLDKMLLKTFIEENQMKMLGLGEPKDFVGRQLEIPNVGQLTIVGVSNKSTPSIYAAKDMFINIIANGKSAASSGDNGNGESTSGEGNKSVDYIDYNLKASEVSIKKGTWPANDYEVLVNEKNKDAMAIGKEIANKVNDKKLKVVGYYSDKKDSDYMLVNNNTLKYDVITKTSNITLAPKDKTAALKDLEANNIKAQDTYAESEKAFKEGRKKSVSSMLIFAGIILAISFIEIFIIIRASFMSRIKEVGVYRAIGVKKLDIYKMFAGEILAITTVMSLPGFIFMAYIVENLSHIHYLKSMFVVNSGTLLFTIAVIYAFNFVFGLIPVLRTIRKTPAEILSRTDVN